MSKVRSIDEIKKEYQEQASIAGHTQYTAAVLQSDLRRMHRRMRELNREAQEAQAQTAPAQEEPHNEQSKSSPE